MIVSDRVWRGCTLAPLAAKTRQKPPLGRSRGTEIGSRGGRELSLSTGTGPSGAAEQLANGFRGARVRVGASHRGSQQMAHADEARRLAGPGL